MTNPIIFTNAAFSILLRTKCKKCLRRISTLENEHGCYQNNVIYPLTTGHESRKKCKQFLDRENPIIIK